MEQNTAPAHITSFKDDYHFLSNFHPAEFVWDNIVWPHSEAAYQAAKSLDRKVRLKVSTMKAGESKRYGKVIELRSDWEDVKIDVMREIVRAKFEQNPALKAKLLATENAYLEEGNQHKDNFWGCCPPGNKRGRNELGKILMELRNEWTD